MFDEDGSHWNQKLRITTPQADALSGLHAQCFSRWCRADSFISRCCTRQYRKHWFFMTSCIATAAIFTASSLTSYVPFLEGDVGPPAQQYTIPSQQFTVSRTSSHIRSTSFVRSMYVLLYHTLLVHEVPYLETAVEESLHTAICTTTYPMLLYRTCTAVAHNDTLIKVCYNTRC